MRFLESSLTAKEYFMEDKKYNEDYFYLAFYLEDKDKSEFLKLQDLAQDNIIYTEESFGRENKPHCTVFYGLKEDKRKEIAEYMKSIKPATISLGEISYFRNSEKDYDVMKIDVIEKNKSLSKVHNYILDNFNNDWSYDSYHPHATIAYVKSGKGDNYQDTYDMYGKEFEIKELTYIDNKKKKYKIPFGG